MSYPKARFEVLDSCLVETDFAEWIQAELGKRGWNVSELVRRSQGLLSETQCSRVLSGTRGFGLDFLRGVATAFGLPLEVVFRRAGWLPDYGEIMPEAKAWSKRLNALSDDLRGRAVRAVEELVAFYESLEGPRRR